MNEITWKTISHILSTLPNIWINSPNNSFLDQLFSLDNYIEEFHQKQSSFFSRKLKDKGTYQTSFFYFLLYFLSQAQPAWIIFWMESIFFGMISGKTEKTIHISCPLSKSHDSILPHLSSLLRTSEFQHIIEDYNIKTIILRDCTHQIINNLKTTSVLHPFYISSIREIPYAVFDLSRTLSLKGALFSNLRWHLNSFEKQHHLIEVIDEITNDKPMFHFLGSWRRQAIQDRGFSYADIRSDKYGALLCSTLHKVKNNDDYCELKNINIDTLFFRILRVDHKISSFHCGYPLGLRADSEMFAHCIGISDLSCPHLSEFAQMDFWRYLFRNKIQWVNDGPSWKVSLVHFKKKFRPITTHSHYWVTLSSDQLNSN